MKSILAIFIFISSMSTAWADDAAPQSKESDHVTQLKWLDSADPDKMLKSDTKDGIYHFYVVCGLACSPDPIGKVDALQCYPNARYLWLEGTTDAPGSAEEARLQDKAQEFAWHYNMALTEYLSKHGMTSCIVGEDWNRAREDMNRRLAEDANHVDQNKVTVAFDKETRRFRFVAYLTPGERNDDTYGSFCGRSAIDHLSGRIIIEIHDRDSRKPLSSIECKYGLVVPSDWISKPDDDYDLPGFELH